MYHDERSDEFWQVVNPNGMATSATFPTRAPQAASVVHNSTQGVASAMDGLIACGQLGALAPRGILLAPFGQGDPGSTFGINVYGWRSTNGSQLANAGGPQNPNARTYLPVLLASYTVTLGQPGPNGGDVNQGYLFAGNIQQTFGPTLPVGVQAQDWFVLPASQGGIGNIALRALGHRWVEVTFQLGAGCTGANALYAKW